MSEGSEVPEGSGVSEGSIDKSEVSQGSVEGPKCLRSP